MVGTGRSVGRGAPGGGGSNRRRRRRQGRGRAPHPSAAPHGVRVQAGGEGGRGAGAAFTGQARRMLPPGGALSPMPGLRQGTGGGGGALRTARAPRLHLPASSKPRSPHCPLLGYPEWPRRALPAGQKRHLAPAPSLPGFRPPASRPCGRLEPPNTGPNKAIQPLGARSGPGCAPGNHRGALAMRRAPHPTITLRIHPGQGGAAVSRAAGPGDRATRERRTRPPGPPRPPPPALPHPTDQPVPSPYPRRRLNPGPARRRARATASAPPPPLPSPPVLTCTPRDAAPDRPAGPHHRPRCLLEPSLRGTPRPTDRPVPLPPSPPA